MSTRTSQLATSVKDLSPRWIKDGANHTTRRYAVLSAERRPWPDFLIVGTKRGGTTSLWNNLMSHPQVLGMFPESRGLKSTEYFFRNWDQPESWYRSHFPTDAVRRRAAGGRPVVTGEASPYYMYGPNVPERINDLLPEVRMIALLRDPVERAYSHYQERRKQGAEPFSFEEALAAEKVRCAHPDTTISGGYHEAHDFYSYRDRGIYLPQILRLQGLVSADRLLIMRSEDFYEDYQSAYDRVCGFLGIEQFSLHRVEHKNKIPRADMAPATRAELTGFFAPHNSALEEHLGRTFGWGS